MSICHKDPIDKKIDQSLDTLPN